MPVRSFWSFVARMTAIEAEEDLRALEIGLACTSGEYAKNLRERLMTRLGQPVVEDRVNTPIDHSAGIARLRQLSRATWRK